MKQIVWKFILPVTVLVLASCSSTPEQIPFRKMSLEELLAYNATVPLEDNVYCFEEARTGSYIRKKHCMTVREIANEMNENSLTLGTLNHNRVPYYGVTGRLD